MMQLCNYSKGSSELLEESSWRNYVIIQKEAHACLNQEDSILSIYLRKFDIRPRRTNSPNSCQEKIITNYIPIFLKIKDYLRLL